MGWELVALPLTLFSRPPCPPPSPAPTSSSPFASPRPFVSPSMLNLLVHPRVCPPRDLPLRGRDLKFQCNAQTLPTCVCQGIIPGWKCGARDKGSRTTSVTIATRATGEENRQKATKQEKTVAERLCRRGPSMLLHAVVLKYRKLNLYLITLCDSLNLPTFILASRLSFREKKSQFSAGKAF